MFRTSPSWTSYVFPSSRCVPRFDASACEPASSRSCVEIVSQRMKPRAMSEWIDAAASSAVWPSAERPRPRLLLARGEERDQVERVAQAADHLVERRRAPLLAELRRVGVRHLRELRLQLQVDPVRPVLDREQRLRRQGLELLRQLARVVAQRVARLQVGEQRLQLLDLLPQRGVTRLRLLLDPLEPPLDMVAVGDEQLEIERLQVAGGIGAGREAVRDRQDRIDLAKPAEQRRPGSGHVDDADRRGRDLPRAAPARPAPRAGRRRSGPCRRSPCRTRRRPSASAQ